VAATTTSAPVGAVANPSLRGAQAAGRTQASGRPRGASLVPALAAAFPRAAWGDVAVPVAVLAVVLAMITPLRPWMLDVLISANITLSVIVLLVAMYITRPVEFSVFPTTLLLLTLFRLALNISSSRLILLEGNSGTAAAGHVIEAFGSFVVGGNYIVGAVIFLVLIAIQYVVINHGAVRISEVTARFTLDAMPGKQMSIDSDLNAGLIDEAEARERRKKLAAESEFYGAMDGASRFTQRDAVASILITGINIIAGFLIGVLQHGMELRRALETYTVLTIGDGLVTVIPALMISISGGLIVTRASSETRLGADFRRQVLSSAEPLFLASGVLLALAAFPGLPKAPFLALGGVVGWGAWRLRRKSAAAKAAEQAPAAPAKENLEALLKVEPLAIHVGLGLVKLVEGGANSPLLRRIAGIRRQMASDLGYLMPPVRVTDNLSLKAGEYVILLKGVEVARYELAPGCELAIQPAAPPARPVQGTPTREPAFGIPALWIPSAMAEAAREAGYTVVDAVSVLGTHLAEVVRAHAHELLSRQDAKRLLDRVAEDNPRVVEDLVPKLLPLATVQKVLQNLLRERVSIRDGVTILEALGDAAQMTKNPVLLTEYVRQAIRRIVVQPYLNASGELAAYLLEASLDRMIEQAAEHGEHTSHLNLAPARVRELADKLARVAGSTETPVVVLASSGARYFVRQIAESACRNVVVIGHGEIPPGVKVVSLGLVE
jgi:flagellar biosynthesis protein FlhA